MDNTVGKDHLVMLTIPVSNGLADRFCGRAMPTAGIRKENENFGHGRGRKEEGFSAGAKVAHVPGLARDRFSRREWSADQPPPARGRYHRDF